VSRETDAREFAEAMGWKFGTPGLGLTWIDTSDPRHHAQGLLYLPTADASLHDQLGFVGRVAEALYPEGRGGVTAQWAFLRDVIADAGLTTEHPIDYAQIAMNRASAARAKGEDRHV
jgi:protein-disulfide isomerase-like protein with CxxC motif